MEKYTFLNMIRKKQFIFCFTKIVCRLLVLLKTVLSKTYLFEKLADIHLAYGPANGNGRKSAKIYGE
jgi:hypothetical protein